MKYILSCFLNLLYPREDVTSWTWKEILLLLTGIIAVCTLIAYSGM